MRGDRRTLRYLREVTGRTGRIILLLTVIQLLLGLSGVFQALLLRNVINAAVAGEREAFVQALLRFGGIVVFQIVLRAGNRHFDEAARSALENRFKERLFETLLRRELSAVNAVHSGEWLSRLTSDAAQCAGGLTGILPGAAGMAVKMAGAIAMLLVLEPRFCFLVLPGGLLLLGVSVLFRTRVKRLHRRVQEQDSRLRTYLQDILGSMEVVRSYAAEAEAGAQAEERMQSHRAARMQKNRFSNLCNAGFGVIMNGAYALGAGFCGYGILTGTMSYGTFTAVLQLIGQIQSPFANLSGFVPQWYGMLASAERLLEAETLPAPEAAPPRPLPEVLEAYASLEAFGLAHANFAYPAQERAALHDLSLEIRRGEFVAFTGRSGCGKSTALKLLPALYPLGGGERYLVREGTRLPLDGSWRRLFAYVPQGNHLMTGTIREIIAFGAPERRGEDAAMHSALAAACAEDFVSALERGLDTPLGERGKGLSEGQLQRIAIARALFSGSPVLLLDESTSALDAATERQLLANLRSMTDRTVMIVTHRPAALEICDRVISFETSEIAPDRVV